jgi:DNA-directed RNA polymerase subunit RPC12/RpoP
MDVAVHRWDAPVVMRPTSYSCARCGMASTVDRQRCRACGARRLVAPAPSGSARTGPAAAEAWAASRAVARATEAVRGGGSPASSRPSTHPVGPWAVVAWRCLHVVSLVAVGAGAVGAARLVLAAATEDQAELLAAGSWRTLADVAGIIGAALVAAAVVATGLVLAWATLAGRTATRLHLDAGAWTRSAERSAARLALVAALAVAWRWAPNGPAQGDRVVDLLAGTSLMAAAVLAAAAVQQLLVVVTTTELQRAEWLLRVDAAATRRPKGRGTSIAG